MRKKTLVQTLLLAGLIETIPFAPLAHGGGFQITEICAQCQGVRNAGAAASAETASVVFFNPAGMTRLQGSQVDANVHLIVPTFEFEDAGSTNAIGGAPQGNRDEDGGRSAVVPTFFYTQEIDERWSVGLGTFTPYGLLTEYNNDWIGRYNAIRSELVSLNFNPAVAFKVNDKFSIGVGLNAIYVDVTLTNALDFGTLAFLAGVPGVTPSTRLFDGRQKLVGDDWGYGWNMGLLYEFSPRTRFGLAFRSDINTTLRGEVRVRGNERLAAINPAFGSRQRDAKADFTVPGTFSFGVFHEVTERWAVMAGATWTHWSTFDEIRVEFDDGGADAVQPENYDNAMRWAIGTQYKLDEHWTLRAGFEYDESPVDNSDRTPRIPDQDRYWLAFGVGYNYSESFQFDFAYTHIFVPDYSIDDTEVTTGALAGVPVGSTLEGDYEAAADIFSLQVTWRF